MNSQRSRCSHSLEDLPQVLLSLVYKQLPAADRGSKQALLSTSKCVRHAILAEATTLTITSAQLHHSAAVNPLVCLPQGVRLQKLVVQGCRSKEDTDRLSTLLQPEDEGTRHKAWRAIQDVQELELQGIIATQTKQPWLDRLPRCIFTPPWILDALRVTANTHCPAVLIVSLCAEAKAKRLKHLQVLPSVRDTDDAYAHAIRALTGLEFLGTLDVWDDATWLAELGQLKCLTLREVPARLRLQLPSSLKVLHVSKADIKGLHRLMQVTNSGDLPKLERLEIGCLELTGLQSEPISGHAFSEWLRASPGFSFVCREAEENADAYNDLNGIFTCPAQLMQGIQVLFVTGIDSLECEDLADACPQLKRLDLKNCSDIQGVLGIFACLPGLETIFVRYEGFPFPSGLVGSMLALCVEAACVPGMPHRELILDFGRDYMGNYYGWSYDHSKVVAEIRDAWAHMHSNLSRCGVPCKVTLRIPEQEDSTASSDYSESSD